jgi:hypothetical protein
MKDTGGPPVLQDFRRDDLIEMVRSTCMTHGVTANLLVLFANFAPVRLVFVLI